MQLITLFAFYSLAILTLRVYALFNRKRVILWMLILAGLVSLAVGVVRALTVPFELYLIESAVARKHSGYHGPAPRKFVHAFSCIVSLLGICCIFNHFSHSGVHC
jgi:hypothetical protein